MRRVLALVNSWLEGEIPGKEFTRHESVIEDELPSSPECSDDIVALGIMLFLPLAGK